MGDNNMVEITLPVIVCWLWAIWWAVLGYRDFYMIQFHNSNKRYRKTVPYLLATLASMNAVLMGWYFVYSWQKTIIIVLLVLMTILWVLWIMSAMYYRRHQ